MTDTDTYTYTLCAHCWHFIEPNDDEPGTAAYIHNDDGEKEHDHDAEPSGLVSPATLDQYRQKFPFLFVLYGDGKVGPNSEHFKVGV